MIEVLKKKKLILLIIALFLFLDGLSFLSFLLPHVNTLVFLLILVLTIVLSAFRLEWGLYILWGELLSNSMGQLFFLDIFSFRLSLRIALWSVLLIISLLKIVRGGLKNFSFKKMPYFKLWSFLAIFIALGLFQGLIKNDKVDVFFDFNAWLYFRCCQQKVGRPER